MKKVYIIAPVVALAGFTGLYLAHRGGHQQREAAQAAAARAELAARHEAEETARRSAVAEALALAEQRKREKAAREAREAADRAERDALVDARDQAHREREKLARQIERVKKEIETEEAALARLAAAYREGEAEAAFLADFVARSRANVQALEALHTKLQSAPVAAGAGS